MITSSVVEAVSINYEFPLLIDGVSSSRLIYISSIIQLYRLVSYILWVYLDLLYTTVLTSQATVNHLHKKKVFVLYIQIDFTNHFYLAVNRWLIPWGCYIMRFLTDPDKCCDIEIPTYQALTLSCLLFRQWKHCVTNLSTGAYRQESDRYQ